MFVWFFFDILQIELVIASDLKLSAPLLWQVKPDVPSFCGALGRSWITPTFATGNTGALRGNVGFHDIISFAKGFGEFIPDWVTPVGFFPPPHAVETTPATVTHNFFFFPPPTWDELTQKMV